MMDRIKMKELENAFRKHGIEAEEAFHCICAEYLEYCNTILGERLTALREKGLGISKRFKNDVHLKYILRKEIESDPNGERLPLYYQYFLQKRFRGSTGKFFTPRPIASAMARLLRLKKDAVIMDPTCGSGTFLIEASKRWKDVGCHLIGNDIDNMLVDLADITLYLATPDKHGKSLYVSNIYNPSHEIQKLFGTIDYILANPPFSLPIDSFNIGSKIFSLGYKSSDALFIDLACKLLKPGGRLVCLLPHSIISNREFRKLRMSVEQDWKLLGVIILPEGVFQFSSDTTTRADIAILMKKGSEEIISKALFCNAPSVGVPLNSRSTKHEKNELMEITLREDVLEALDLAGEVSI